MASAVNKISDENKRKMELTLAQISKRSLSSSSSSSSVPITAKGPAASTSGTDEDRLEVADAKQSLERGREKGGDVEEEGKTM